MSKALREQLLSEKNSYGIMLSEMYVPNITRLIARCGFDFILIDCEHGYFDMSQVANLIAVADGAEISTIVRVTQPSRTNITKYLDMGAHGILLSDVTGADDRGGWQSCADTRPKAAGAFPPSALIRDTATNISAICWRKPTRELSSSVRLNPRKP